MFRKIFTCVLVGYVLARCVIWSGACLGAPNSPTPASPKSELKLTAEEILDREAQAKGKEAHRKVKTFALKMKIVNGDTKVVLTVNYAGPGKHSMVQELEGIGTQEVVVNGDKAWINDTLSGARFLNAQEKQTVIDKAEGIANILRTAGDWRKLVKEVRLVGEENINGKPAYKVQVTNEQGEKAVHYYDKESSHLVRREAKEGDQQTVEHYSDFRKVDGLVQPFTTRIVNGSMEMVITIEQFVPNAEIPAGVFVPPSELNRQSEK